LDFVSIKTGVEKEKEQIQEEPCFQLDVFSPIQLAGSYFILISKLGRQELKNNFINGRLLHFSALKVSMDASSFKGKIVVIEEKEELEIEEALKICESGGASAAIIVVASEKEKPIESLKESSMSSDVKDDLEKLKSSIKLKLKKLRRPRSPSPRRSFFPALFGRKSEPISEQFKNIKPVLKKEIPSLPTEDTENLKQIVDFPVAKIHFENFKNVLDYLQVSPTIKKENQKEREENFQSMLGSKFDVPTEKIKEALKDHQFNLLTTASWLYFDKKKTMQNETDNKEKDPNNKDEKNIEEKKRK